MIRSVFSVFGRNGGRNVWKRGFSQVVLNKNPIVGIRPLNSSLVKTPAALRPLGGLMQVHDTRAKGDDELINFLGEEIATEKKIQKSNLPSNLDGFEIKLAQSEITLTKKVNNETLTVTMNVNHTVDADFSEEQETNPKGEKDAAEMRSRPNFEIDIQKGNQTLTFSCSYLQDVPANEPQQEEYQDAFVIDEIALYEGEWNEKVYAVAGDILDGYLYDLFMNMLEERGVGNEFVEKLSDFCTDYEHQMYVNMLHQLQNFFTSK